jgi:phospholipid/cholesterol/gamma-HCH transport system substrate-binding protein
LSDNKDTLVSTVNNLQSFTSTLANDDQQTRAFTSDLSQVSQQLDSERADFSSALHNLGIALSEVSGFIKDNRRELSSDVRGLSTVTQILAKERTLLAHLVDIGAVGVSNYPHMYTPSQRTYNARFDGNSISDNPALFVCQLAGAAGLSGADCLKTLDPLKGISIPTAPGSKK